MSTNSKSTFIQDQQCTEHYKMNVYHTEQASIYYQCLHFTAKKKIIVLLKRYYSGSDVTISSMEDYYGHL